jgi:anti-anti-sigma regulatory factor
MTTNAMWIRVDAERVADILRHEALEKLNSAEGELVLDFSSVERIDTEVAKALEELAGKAATRPVKVVLHGVNVDVYRVLKLLKLAQRFAFVS